MRVNARGDKFMPCSVSPRGDVVEVRTRRDHGRTASRLSQHDEGGSEEDGDRRADGAESLEAREKEMQQQNFNSGEGVCIVVFGIVP